MPLIILLFQFTYAPCLPMFVHLSGGILCACCEELVSTSGTALSCTSSDMYLALSVLLVNNIDLALLMLGPQVLQRVIH